MIAAAGVFGTVYAFVLIMACLELSIEHDVPLQGLFWRALPQPFVWLWQFSARTVAFLGPPPRAPRRTRLQMEQRIAELERELEIRD